MKKNQSVKKGFTLIELIVVIAILGILAAVLLPKFSGFTDNARKKSAMSEAKNCYTAMSTYYADNGEYPKDAAKLTSLSTELQKRMTITSPAPTTGEGTLFIYTSDKGIKVTVPENGTISEANVTKS